MASLVRRVSAAFLTVAGLVILFLAGEVWLRFQRRIAEGEAETYRSRNVFAFPDAMHAAEESLWKKPRKKYRPGARLDLTVGGERYSVHINSLGFRTPEFSPRKAAGTFRVICIGGSTTVAGRTNDETYPAFLERKLRERFPSLRTEVLNLGISGTTSDYWVARREQLFALGPDVVVEYSAINDIFWNHLKRYAAARPWRTRLHRSLLVARAFPLDPQSFDPLLADTVHNFGEMERECRRRGARYVLGSFASPDPVRASPAFRAYLDVALDFWNRELPLRSYAEYRSILARHNLQVERFAHERGVELAPVAREIDEPRLFIDLCHLTPEGIERLADAFLPPLERVIESGAWLTTSPSTSRGRPAASKRS